MSENAGLEAGDSARRPHVWSMHPRGSAAPYSDHASAVSAAPFPDATTAQPRRKTHEPAPYTWRQDASPLSPDELPSLVLPTGLADEHPHAHLGRTGPLDYASDSAAYAPISPLATTAHPGPYFEQTRRDHISHYDAMPHMRRAPSDRPSWPDAGGPPYYAGHSGDLPVRGSIGDGLAARRTAPRYVSHPGDSVSHSSPLQTRSLPHSALPHADRGHEEISTLFIAGFPDNIREREFNNMFLFARGFEATMLKLPTPGSGARDEPEASHDGDYAHIQPVVRADDSGAAGTRIRQTIGFAKFRSREEALEARDVLNGFRIDSEKGCIIKAEMAKKNLHMKRTTTPATAKTSSSAYLQRTYSRVPGRYSDSRHPSAPENDASYFPDLNRLPPAVTSRHSFSAHSGAAYVPRGPDATASRFAAEIRSRPSSNLDRGRSRSAELRHVNCGVRSEADLTHFIQPLSVSDRSVSVPVQGDDPGLERQASLAPADDPLADTPPFSFESSAHPGGAHPLWQKAGWGQHNSFHPVLASSERPMFGSSSSAPVFDTAEMTPCSSVATSSICSAQAESPSVAVGGQRALHMPPDTMATTSASGRHGSPSSPTRSTLLPSSLEEPSLAYADLDDAAASEQSAYSDGYAAGLAKGDEIGALEGLVMGREKGFEVWEELGYYAGLSRLYERAIKSEQCSGKPSRKAQKQLQNLEHLESLLKAMPRNNDPSRNDESLLANDDDSLEKVLERIRARYKLVCASLGISPRARGEQAAEQRDPRPSQKLSLSDLTY